MRPKLSERLIRREKHARRAISHLDARVCAETQRPMQGKPKPTYPLSPASLTDPTPIGFIRPHFTGPPHLNG